MSADLERLLSNRQEMALVKKLLSAAVKDSQGGRKVAGKDSEDKILLEKTNDAHARSHVAPMLSKMGKGDGPKIDTSFDEELDAYFAHGNPDAPKPTVFTRPKIMLT